MGFGAQTTLGYKRADNSATSAAIDNVHAAKMQLLGQYIASNFVSGSPAGGTTIHDAHASSLTTNLTKSS